MGIPICLNDNFEVVSVNDTAIDISASPKQEGTETLLYLGTKDLADLVIKEGMKPVRFIIKPLNRKDRKRYLRESLKAIPKPDDDNLDSTFRGSDIAEELFEKCVVDIKDWFMPDGITAVTVGHKKDGALDEATLEKIDDNIRAEIGWAVLHVNQLTDKEKKV